MKWRKNKDKVDYSVKCALLIPMLIWEIVSILGIKIETSGEEVKR